LTWQPQPSAAVLKDIDGLLSKAIERNVRYAAAYAWLGEIRAATGTPDGAIGLIRRAIALEPREAAHRLRAANVMLDQDKPLEARADAQAALALADDDRERRAAQERLDRIAKTGKDSQ
jgi:tetratricopeptide (TPR) repeat protein